MKRIFNRIFLITSFKLLQLLSVVCEFGSQANVCKIYIQNICSVVTPFFVRHDTFESFPVNSDTYFHIVPFTPFMVKILSISYEIFQEDLNRENKPVTAVIFLEDVNKNPTILNIIRWDVCLFG